MTDKIISKTNTNEEAIKKSIFIGVCAQVKSSEEFFEFLSRYQDPSATHNCWAYRIGNEYRFNDDGEPSGTAGKPILSAIDGLGFNYIGALVIRHYGGIKLGTGGLARAYGGTIAKNLQKAPYKLHVPHVELMIKIDFQYEQVLYQLLKQFDGINLGQQYISEGLIANISVPEKNTKDFQLNLNNHTKGNASIELKKH